jgi:hypothetical protein
MSVSYYVAWLLYFLAAAGILFIYEQYITAYFKSSSWKVLIRTSLYLLIFTPTIISTDEHYLPIPALVSTMFNILTHAKMDVAISLIPLLVSFFIAFMAIGLWGEWRKNNN